MTKSNSRLRQQCNKLCNIVVGVLSLAPCYVRKKRVAGTSPGVPGDILGSYEELRWMEPHMSSPSPCKLVRNENEVLHLYRWDTHTHCRTQLFHPTCLAPSPFLPAFPISFSHLFGDHWKKLICGVIPSFNLRSLAGLPRFGRVNFHSWRKSGRIVSFQIDRKIGGWMDG